MAQGWSESEFLITLLIFNMIPVIPLIPLLGALLPLLAGRCGRNACAWTTAAVAMASLILLLWLAPPIFDGVVLQTGWRWLPELGLNFTFRLDGLALLFGLLIT